MSEIDPSAPSIDVWSAVHHTPWNLEIPGVACLEGGAINAGASLALACDLMVAGDSAYIDSAYIQMREAAMGVTPPMNAAWLAMRFPAAVGMQLALSSRAFRGPDVFRLMALLALDGDDSYEPFGPITPRFRPTSRHMAGVSLALGHTIYRKSFARELDIELDSWDRRVFAAWARLAPP